MVARQVDLAPGTFPALAAGRELSKKDTEILLFVDCDWFRLEIIVIV